MTGPGPIQLADPLIGATVGEYTIVDAVGEGGMGVVYRGVQPVIKKRVAVKVLKPSVAADEQHVNRLISEAEAVNAIRHRGIIDIFGLGRLPDGRPYIVMEFLEGEPLDAYLRRSRPSLRETLELVIEMCSALGAAHTAGVVHRDLKPSNVFLCRQSDGTQYIKLLDFGLAKRVQGITGSTAQTSQAVVTGTPDYMAPEQARGLEVSPRTDVYALGVMLFELVRGHVPFTGDAPMDVMVSHVSKTAPPLNSGHPALDQLVAKMLLKDPAHRPQTGEVKSGLEAVAQAFNPHITGELRAPSAPLPPVRSSPLPLMVGGALALLGLGVAAVTVASREPQPEKLATPAPRVEPSAQLDAAVEPAEVNKATARHVDAGRPPAREPARPQPAARAIPSTRMLLDRITRDEARTSDPSALLFLKSERLKLKADDSPAARRRTQLALEKWEHTYLE